MHISFITTIKICPGYEWLLDRINIYILNIQHYCKKYDIPYEILICEQIDNKNVFLCKDRLVPHNPTTLKWGNLNINDYLDSSIERGKKSYELFSVCLHHGESISFGHYTSNYLKTNTKKFTNYYI